MEAQGSVLTNKYAEGYPGRRYYGGCEHVDVVEQIAIDRVKALFGAEHANVQPHSGAQANAAAMFALLKPGDTIMGLNLAHGGAPDPRHEDQLLRQALQRRPLPRGRRRSGRHGRGGAPRQGDQAEADRGRLVGVPEAAGLRRVPQGRGRGRRVPDGRHGALRRSGRGGPAPEPGPARPRGDHHDPQDAGRPPRRCDPLHGRTRQEDQLRRLPRSAGWPAGARGGRQGRRLQGRRERGLQGAPRAVRWRVPASWPSAWCGTTRGGGRLGPDRRHGRPPGPGGPARLRAGRAAGRGPPPRGRHHGQPQRRPGTTRVRRW